MYFYDCLQIRKYIVLYLIQIYMVIELQGVSLPCQGAIRIDTFVQEHKLCMVLILSPIMGY